MSLILRSRLISDSTRSPTVAVHTSAAPNSAPCHHWPSSISVTVRMPATMPATIDPAKPSQDFFGLMTLAIGCLPNHTPAANPPVSELTTRIRKHSTRATPSSGTTSIAANEASSGTYAAVSTDADRSRR